MVASTIPDGQKLPPGQRTEPDDPLLGATPLGQYKDLGTDNRVLP